MINRNTYSEIKKDENGKRYLSDTFLPYLRRSENDIYIYSVEGDSLDQIAEEYYGSGHYWFILADINNLDSMNLKGGIQLRIPDFDKYMDALEEINS